MIKIEIKEGRLRVFREKKESVQKTPEIAVFETESTIKIIAYKGIRENRIKGISFDMILCNKKTFMKTLKEASGLLWEDFKREMAFDFFEQKPPKHLKLFGYMFGVNEESETIEDDEFIFLKDCRKVSEFKGGKLLIIKEVNYGRDIRH